MNYKKYLLIFVIFYSCTTIDKKMSDVEPVHYDGFISKGFALVYSENFKKNKTISKKLDTRSLNIFQKNIKKGKFVKITNLLNNKSLIATVGNMSTYPSFYNSVISERIFEELEMNPDEPYVEIYEINENSTFVAKKAVTYDEEKNVANKAPVDGISIKDLNIDTNKTKKNDKKRKFKYIIKIAEFYFKDTAHLMKKRILNETNIKKVNIETLSTNNYRVYLGPFNDLNSLKNNFNSINKLDFENLELIKK